MKIAIASGKGGTGKTFVSVNLFHTLREMGKHVSLIDCDVEVPNALAFFSACLHREKNITEYRPIIDRERCVFCGKCVQYCEYHAIFYIPASRQINLLNELCHGCAACNVACDFNAIEDSSTVIGKVSTYNYQQEVCLAEGRMITGSPSPVPLIKAAVKQISEDDFEYILYDAPPGTSCPFIQTVSKADYVVLVTEPTPFGLSDLIQAVETLNVMNKSFGIIINRSGIGNQEIYNYINDNNLNLLLEIPFDEEIAKLHSEEKVAVKSHLLLKELFQKLTYKLIANGNCCD